MRQRFWTIPTMTFFITLVLVLPSLASVLGTGSQNEGPASRSMRLVPSQTGTLYGFVTDWSGNPLQGATIVMDPTDGRGLKRTATTQAGGYYTQNLEPKGWDLTVSMSGYFDQGTNVNIYSGETTRHDFNLEKVPPIDAKIHGKVTNNSTHNPVFDATIYLMDAVRMYSTNVSTTLIGTYNIKIYAGDFVLFAHKNGYLDKFLGGIHLTDGENRTIDLVLFPAPAMNARFIGDISYQFNNGTIGPIVNASLVLFDPVKSFFAVAQADPSGHFDFNLYPTNFKLLVKSDTMPILDSSAVNVTTLANQVVTENFKLKELPPAQVLSHVNLTRWDRQHLSQNMTSWGRMSDSSMGSIRAMRFLFDVYFGNGDQYLTAQEVKIYTDMFSRDITNSMGMYDTSKMFTVDKVDFIFNKTVDSDSVDMSGSVYGNKPIYIQVDIGLRSNGTIRDDVPNHHVWLNQTYNTNDSKEEVYIDFPDIFTIKNISASKTMQLTQTKNTTLHMIAGVNPDPKSTNRSDSITLDLVYRIPPVANPGPDRTVNEDTDVVFDGSASSDRFGLLFYNWDFGDGSKKNSTVPTVTHNYPQPGKYDVTLTVVNKVLLQSSTKLHLTVKDVTPPKVTIAINSTTVNEDIKVLFRANATDNVAIVNITWWLETKLLGNGTTLNWTFGAPGKYTITVKVSDTSNLTAQASADMTALDVTPPVSVPGQNRTVNESQEVNFDGSSSNDNVGVTSYTWTFGDNSTSVTGSLTGHTYTRPGNYTVTLNVTDAAGHWNKRSIWVLVKDITPPVATIRAARTTVLVNDKVLFNSTGSYDNVGIVSYSWDFGDKTTAGGPVVNHTYKNAGTYKVNLTVRDAAGFKAVTTLTVTVAEPSNPYLSAVCIGSLLGLVFIGGIGAYLVYRRLRLGGYKIEEAFVIYEDGRLIKHISTRLTEDADKEVIASMLTAVQDFVKDSLKKKEGEFLGKIEFGKKTKILIERGKRIYLAIVLAGHDPESLRNLLAKTVAEVEERYHKKLNKWDGDIDAFKGLDEMVIDLVEK